MNDDLLNLRTGFAVIGHRGAAGLAPENTLPSFAKALSLGCTGIELDVHAVQDQQGATQLCVIHDKRVDRTTNASGLVADYSAEALAALDAGSGAGVVGWSVAHSDTQLYEARRREFRFKDLCPPLATAVYVP